MIFKGQTVLIGVVSVCCTAGGQRHCGFQGASKVIVIHLLQFACVRVRVWM